MIKIFRLISLLLFSLIASRCPSYAGAFVFGNDVLEFPDGSSVKTAPRDGKSVLSGAGAPGSFIANVGDFYIDITNIVLYGPFVGHWGEGRSLVGPQGLSGPNLVSGSTVTTFSGLLKGNGTNVEQAISGVDYLEASYVARLYGNALNVLDAPYNCDNTGTLDTTTCLNNAIQNSGDKNVIVLPAGVYKITNSINLPSRKILVAQHAPRTSLGGTIMYPEGTYDGKKFAATVIQYFGPANGAAINIKNGGGLYGLHILGDLSVPGWTGTGVKILNDEAVYPPGSGDKNNDGFIVNCWIRGVINGLEATKIQAWLIAHNTIDNVSGFGMKFNGVGNTSILGNILFYAQKDGALIFDEFISSADPTKNYQSSRNVISGNIMMGNKAPAIVLKNAYYNTITSNSINRNTYGILIDGTYGAKNNIISVNQFNGNTYESIIVKAASDILIQGNMFTPYPNEFEYDVPYVRVTDGASRINISSPMITGGIKKTGIELSYDTTESVVETPVFNNITYPVKDLNGYNIVWNPGKITTVSVPSFANSPCSKGQIALNDSYMFVCVNTNSWRQIQLNSF